jgi:hypothetical protein
MHSTYTSPPVKMRRYSRNIIADPLNPRLLKCTPTCKRVRLFYLYRIKGVQPLWRRSLIYNTFRCNYIHKCVWIQFPPQQQQYHMLKRSFRYYLWVNNSRKIASLHTCQELPRTIRMIAHVLLDFLSMLNQWWLCQVEYQTSFKPFLIFNLFASSYSIHAAKPLEANPTCSKYSFRSRVKLHKYLFIWSLIH